MFGRGKKQQPPMPYDKTGKVPVIRASICTGERTAGFRDLNTGRFQEIMLIRDEGDLQAFLAQYQVEEAELKREW